MAELTDYSKFDKYPPKQNKNVRFILLFIFLLILISIFFINKFWPREKENISKPIVNIVKEIIDKSSSFFNPGVNSKTLENIIQNQLKNSKGDYGIVIKKKDLGEHYILFTVKEHQEGNTGPEVNVLAAETFFLNKAYYTKSGKYGPTDGFPREGDTIMYSVLEYRGGTNNISIL